MSAQPLVHEVDVRVDAAGQREQAAAASSSAPVIVPPSWAIRPPATPMSAISR